MKVYVVNPVSRIEHRSSQSGSVSMSTAHSEERPTSSASTRPSTSASVRSLASSRPPSSIGSSRRPATSASRPTSRATQRPPSRIAPRSSTRQSTRLTSLYQDLVTRLTVRSADHDQDNFETLVDFVSRNLDPLSNLVAASTCLLFRGTSAGIYPRVLMKKCISHPLA